MWELAGAANVTHLGKSTVTQRACKDGVGHISGDFEYEGRTGGYLAGTYEGSLDDSKMEARVTVLAVNGINALPDELPEGVEKWGGGVIEGTLTDSDFSYELVGWLFHI